MADLLFLALLACATPPDPSGPDAAAQGAAPALDDASAIRALAPHEIASRRDELIARLQQHPDAEVRMAAVAALAYVGRDRASLPALCAALEQEAAPAVQQRLVAALAGMGGPEAVDAIVTFWLRGPDPSIDAAVRSALLGTDPDTLRRSLDVHASIDPARAEGLRSELPR